VLPDHLPETVNVAELTALTSTAPALLTGDNARAATTLAAQIGITDIRAGLLPQDKVTAVRELEDAGRRVLLIGDGVNDAPALAAAHTGVAMGRAGSDLALETADAVIVRDDLATLPAVIALSRRARRIVIANLAIATTFITGLVLWDLLGHLPLPLGVAGHEGSTVIVGLNGMRLLAQRAWTNR
jgi:P-type E1-E2 ATPase